MAATAQDPPRTVAGREGPLKWAPDPNEQHQWIAPDGARAPARIRFLSNSWQGEVKDRYHVYRNGRYLGVRTELPAAKALGDSDRADPDPNRPETMDGTSDGMPAFLVLSKAERQHAWKNAPQLTTREMQTSWRNYKLRMAEKGEDLSFMSKYEAMGLEQLAREYNTLVESARGMGIDSVRPVARFKDKDAGLEAIAMVESRIRARQSSEATVKKEARTKSAGPTPREVTPASPQPAKDEDTMATKANGNGAKKAKKKVAKKAGAKKVAAAPKGPKVYERPAGKKGEFTEKLGTRPDTNKDKLALFLFDNLGKAVPVEKVAKAVYGNASEKSVKALPNVVGGLKNDIDAAKVSYHIKREDSSIGLYTGSGK
jgi:hypothetical protein